MLARMLLVVALMVCQGCVRVKPYSTMASRCSGCCWTRLGFLHKRRVSYPGYSLKAKPSDPLARTLELTKYGKIGNSRNTIARKERP